MIEVQSATVGNFYFHKMRRVGKAGHNVIATHKHNYDHVLECREGRLMVYSANKGAIPFLMTKGQMVEIPADIEHDLEFLEDGTEACCVHILRDEHGNTVPFSFEKTTRRVLELTSLLEQGPNDDPKL